MNKQKCQRCNSEQYIPTEQYIKFDGLTNYVCDPCWKIFNRWFYGEALQETKPNPGRLYPSGVVTGKDPSWELQTGREPNKTITLNVGLMRIFKKWFFAGNKEGLEKRIE